MRFTFTLFFSVTLLLAWMGCSHAPPIPSQYTRESYSDTQSVDVYYATNRELSPGAMPSCSDAAFGVTQTQENYLGICRLNVPKKHPVGGIELAPTPRADPHSYYRFLSHTLLNEDGIKAVLKSQKPSKPIMVFVHGFNVKFEEAILRAGQLAYDLKFPGSVMVFSWPAGPAPGFFGGKMINRTYEANTGSASASVAQFGAFLKILAGLETEIHLGVHSMGHQVVLPALLAIANESGAKPFINELVLNAPDFPLDQFAKHAEAARKIARRITVYCSFNDNAIAASETFNNGRRLGACERAEGVDMINVSEIDAPAMGVAGLGHSYYASRPILTDVSQLLMGVEAEKRLFIRKSEPNSTENFYLRP